MSEGEDRVGKALARFDRVMAVIDEREGAVATQARRERQRTARRFGRAFRNALIAIGVVAAAAIAAGLVSPLGLLGFLAAVMLAVTAAVVAFLLSSRGAGSAPTVPKDASNGEMVQRFDSFVYRTRRALPAPAQQVMDKISAELVTLKQVLERTDARDPDAAEARRLMSVHLPGLIERYANVPPAYRGEADGEGKTVDERLVEGLSAGRSALADVSERLAQRDVDAFGTQGRFIESKYGKAE